MKSSFDLDHIPLQVAILLVPALIVIFAGSAYLINAGYDLRWILIPVTSVVIFGYVIPGNRHLWKTTWFWLVCGALATVGALGWLVVLVVSPNWPVLGYTVACTAEGVAVVIAIGVIEDAFGKKGKGEEVRRPGAS